MIRGAHEFGQFIRERLGCEPPRVIEPGRFVRFPTNGKHGDDAGWAKLFADLGGGVVGDFRAGETYVWQATRERPYTDAEQRAWRERIAREQHEAEALREREEKQAAERARTIWTKAQPAPEDHPYLAAKRVQPHGLRLYRGPLAVNGMRCDGALIVPVGNAAGEFQSVEFISPQGEKRFLAGGCKAGGYYFIGKPADVLCIAEGFGTGATVYEATGHAVAVAFDAGNLELVAKALREKFPRARIVIAADNDASGTGQRKAAEAARASGGLIALPAEEGKDWNDVHRERGAEAVRCGIKGARDPEAAVHQARADDDVSGLLLRRVSDVQARPVRWLWPGRIARGKVSMIAGHPGLGKSQLCISIAAIVSTGGLWPVDRTRCERGSVLIASAEDDAEDTIRPRLEAAGADLTRVHVLEAVAVRESDGSLRRRGFSLVEDMPRLAAKLAELQDVALVVIDPISAFLGDTDSHQNAAVRAVLAPLAEVAAKHGAAVIAVSHLRKSAGGEAMLNITGSLAFVAAARAAYIVAKDQADLLRRLLLPAKNNLGDDQTGYAFKIEPANLPSGIGTSRIAWEAERVTVTAEEALVPAQDREERSAIEEAADFLRAVLADAPMPAKRLLAEAREAGHAEKTIRQAAKAISVEHYKDGMQGGWLWKLAPKMAKTREDAQGETLATFGDVGHLREPEAASEAPSAGDAEVI
jgi:putative DNA primase/helicase